MDETIQNKLIENFKMNLFAARTDAGLTQKELGEKIDLGTSSQQIISAWESGKGRLPSLLQLFSLSEALKTDPIKLLYNVRKEHLAIFQELGLSDETIITLRENQFDAEDDEMDPVNCAALVIDAIIGNKRLADLLYWYLFGYFDTLFFDGEENSISAVDANKVVGVRFKDFEALYRVQLMDELKSTREALSEKREAISQIKSKAVKDYFAKYGDAAVNRVANMYIQNLQEREGE